LLGNLELGELLMSDREFPQDNLVLELVSPALDDGKPAKWAGPYKTPRATRPKRCVGCGSKLSAPMRRIRADWCETCKDPDGYLQRLEKASAAARDRCREAYAPADAEQLLLFSDDGEDLSHGGFPH
jgi:hypothetical protein